MGHITWNPVEGIKMKNLFIADQSGDTLFYIGQLNTKLKLLDRNKQFVYINSINLEDVLVNFRMYSGTDRFNYEFFIDAVSPPSDPNDTSEYIPWTILFEKLHMENGCFRMRIDDDVVTGRKFNESDMKLEHIYADLENFYLIDDSLNFYAKNLSLKEHNSFEIKNIQSHCIVSRQGMYFTDLLLQTPNSTLTDYFSMQYGHWRDFNEFNDKVKLEGRLKNSVVSFKDIRLFSDELVDWDADVTMDGHGLGVLRHLDIDSLDLHFADNTHIKGKLKMDGLPNIDITQIHADIDYANSNRKELASLIPLDVFPQAFEKLGNVQFQGNYSGSIIDFVAKGDFQTDLGLIKTNLHMVLGDSETYEGELETFGFEAGKFFELNDFHQIDFVGSIKGKGFDLETMEAEIDATIPRFGVLNYDYQNLLVTGTVRNQFFLGDIEINDPNLNMTFSGKASLEGEVPTFDCVSRINHIELEKLKLAEDFPLKMSGDIVLDFQGTGLDDLLGSIEIKNVELEKDLRIHYIQSAKLVSSNKAGYRKLELKSELVDASIYGSFLPSQLGNSFNNFLAQLLPSLIDIQKIELENQHFDFAVNFKNTKDITELFFNQTWVQNSSLQGSFNTSDSSLSLESNIQSAHVGNFEFHNVIVRVDSSFGDQQFNIEVSCTEILESDSIIAHGVGLDFEMLKNHIVFSIKGYSDVYQSEMNLAGDLDFSEGLIESHFKPSYILVDTLKWEIKPNSIVQWVNDSTLRFIDFVLSGQEQSIFINGTAIGGYDDDLDLNLKQFNLASLNPFLFPKGETSIQGLAEGTIHIRSFSGSLPLFTSDLKINNLGYGGDRLGNLILSAKVPKGYELITLNGQLQDGYTQRVSLSGFVNTSKNNPAYNLKLEMDTTPIQLFQPFLNGLVSELKGTGRGRIDLSGTFDKPVIKGKLFLDSAGMKVDYLNTSYQFSSVVNISSNRIDLGRFKVTDENNNTGFCSGYIGHDFLKDFDLHIELNNLKNFLCLNTTLEDNPYYYGSALMTGTALFTGPIDDLKIDVKGRAEKGSAFFVPLENYGGSSELEFIRFVNFDNYGESTTYQDLSGIQMRFDLEITPSTEIQLIFDSKLGDIIRARGYSKLLMEINSNGDFKMYGDYEVEEGDYLFTAINLINKKFVIKKGGKITWNGDPMKANLNLEASYRTKATLENLVSGLVKPEELEAYRQRTDVEAVMKLRGELTSPEIRFGFLLPNLSTLSSTGVNVSNLQTVMRRIESDQEEMTRQVFSLMVANTFIRPAVNQQYMAGGADVQSGLLSSSVGDLLSNQVSNWLGQINSNWNLGVNYVMGVQQSDLLINASRKFFDDRLEIEGTFGTTTNFYNNVSAVYTITPDGRLRVRAFNRTGVMQNVEQQVGSTVNSMNRNINTQGVGLQYSIEFDRLTEERREIRRRLREEKKASEIE